jgi:exoribonuclease R
MARNQRVLVEFESWTDTLPRGVLIKTYGACGDYKAELAAAEAYATAQLKKKGADIGLGTYEPVVPPSYIIGNIPDTASIFNIDPPGCEDIDDVIAYEAEAETEADLNRFWIIISAAAAYVPAGSPLDREAYQRTATLYNVEGQVLAPMLPEALSAGAASLKADGRRRLGVAWEFVVGDGDSVVEDCGFKLVWLCNQKSYTYDNVTSNAGYEAVATLTSLCKALGPRGSAADPHVWIETAMVAYNERFARWLVEYGCGLIRSHKGAVADRYEAYKRLGGPALAMYAIEAARYVPYNAVTTGHIGLGKEIYTHASSPLRRYADLHNQHWFLHMTYPGTYPPPIQTFDCEYAHARSKALKSYARASHFLQCLLVDKPQSIKATIIEVCEAKGKVRIYVEAWSMIMWWRGVPADLVSERIIGCVVELKYYVNKNAAGWKEKFVLELAFGQNEGAG